MKANCIYNTIRLSAIRVIMVTNLKKILFSLHLDVSKSSFLLVLTFASANILDDFSKVYRASVATAFRTAVARVVEKMMSFRE